MIELRNVTKYFNQDRALDNISLTAETGKTTVIIGQSGCGKSTLLRIITGLTKHDNGSVKVEGNEITDKNISEIRRKIGFVIQEGGLFPHLSARKNISLMAEYLKWSESKISNRIKELVTLTKFPNEGLTKYPVQLSGGQRQRVSLMRALMLDPHILLLDEPLGALDPLIRYDLQTDLKEIFQKLNKTVVMVTHDLSEAVYFGEKIILMNNGKIVQSGNSIELLDKPKNDFVEKFINAQRSLR
ncbi:MAG: ABC transporter ATP-binding protein [Melioribacteraceae bacterium]|nr:ABC transporter ATP-binding protein [Melioribacteraceae bacterium]MCF8352985.1 ABC transporter ATP-binding protein [Melioribacteraceae bacterium]MCF8392876.1 ABC transporter ATP-binding protein [Melioribacteraceae bacterium]MCF8417830.1 ABC transporter ATP-binding protein [Melioribacteraceae bacterium]